MQAIRVAMDLILRDIKWTMRFNEREEQELIEKLGMYFRLMDRALLESSRAEPRLAGHGDDPDRRLHGGPRGLRRPRRRLPGVPAPRRHDPAADPGPHAGPGPRRCRQAAGRLGGGASAWDTC